MKRIALLVFAIGCDDTSYPPPQDGGGTTITGDDWDAASSVFDAHCTSCHGGANPLANLSLESDACADLVDGRLVVAGDSAASLVWQRMSGQTGSLMPPTGAVPSVALDTVVSWIDAGASCTGDTGGVR